MMITRDRVWSSLSYIAPVATPSRVDLPCVITCKTNTPACRILLVSHWRSKGFFQFEIIITVFKGFVKLKKIKKSDKNSEVGGWVKP